MGRSLASRVKIVGPAFVVGAALSALAAGSGASKMGWGLGDFAFVWGSVLAGPFSGLWFATGWGMADAVGWAIPCGLAIVCHPARPGWLTGLVSGIGIALWILLGFVLTYDGV
ncbi:hypothetical protein R5W23_005675 [Gemmata sp. JC673]|uniref:DUF1097 domain-containing protein n=1 Tax=Gemmata algarum TaxID=2975278 RepID=A0ABU5EVR2_9BACT|nr:hypothetical protein [Gemmata algarum]MDY3558555.1 hypothetical protein [Gemmata algarum]